MHMKSLIKSALVGAAAMVAGGLGGCGLDEGVQLNGKIFDAMGMTGSVKKEEPKLAQRQPLVVPPGLESLPQPGSGKAEQPSLAEVQDYDATRTTSKEQLAQQQAAYCKVHYEQARALGDDNADLAEGPLGPCRGSVLNAIGNINKASTDEE